MFWAKETPTAVEDLLNRDDVTLRALLDEPCLLQDVRSGNEKLIAFFQREDIIIELIREAFEPQTDLEQPSRDQFKYANTCADLISISQEELTNKYLECAVFRTTIADYVDRAPDANPAFAGFFQRIVTWLTQRCCAEMLNWFEEVRLIEKLATNGAIRHGAIAEFLTRIVNVPIKEPDIKRMRKMVADVLPGSLLHLLESDKSATEHIQADYVFSELVRGGREQWLCSEQSEPDPILDALCGTDMVHKLVQQLLNKDVSDTLLSALCSILGMLVETNATRSTPLRRHDEFTDRQMFGSGPASVEQSLCNPMSSLAIDQNDQQPAFPDPAFVTEVALADQLPRLLDICVDHLETSLNAAVTAKSDVWWKVAQLILRAANVDIPEARRALSSMFEDEAFGRLLDIAAKHPQVAVMHSFVHRLAAIALWVVPDAEAADEQVNSRHPANVLLAKSGIFTHVGNWLERVAAAETANRAETSAAGASDMDVSASTFVIDTSTAAADQSATEGESTSGTQQEDAAQQPVKQSNSETTVATPPKPFKGGAIGDRWGLRSSAMELYNLYDRSASAPVETNPSGRVVDDLLTQSYLSDSTKEAYQRLQEKSEAYNKWNAPPPPSELTEQTTSGGRRAGRDAARALANATSTAAEEAERNIADFEREVSSLRSESFVLVGGDVVDQDALMRSRLTHFNEPISVRHSIVPPRMAHRLPPQTVVDAVDLTVAPRNDDDDDDDFATLRTSTRSPPPIAPTQEPSVATTGEQTTKDWPGCSMDNGDQQWAAFSNIKESTSNVDGSKPKEWANFGDDGSQWPSSGKSDGDDEDAWFAASDANQKPVDSSKELGDGWPSGTSSLDEDVKTRLSLNAPSARQQPVADDEDEEY